MMTYSKRLPKLFFIFFSLLWFYLYTVLSPEFGGIDAYVFKDAGANFALGHGFVTRAAFGSQDTSPHLYACYPPGYPFLFGVFSQIFGVGAYQNTFFNLTLSWICSFLWFLILLRFLKNDKHIKWLCLSILYVLLPVAFIESGKDRPEILSCSFILLSIVITEKKFSRKLIYFQSLLVGINGIVSPFGAILHGFIMIFTYKEKLPILGLKKIFFNLSLAMFPLVSIILIYAYLDSSAFARFLEFSAKNRSGVGVVLEMIKTDGLGFYFQHILNIFTKINIYSIGINLSYLLVWFVFPLLFLWQFILKKNTKLFYIGLFVFFLGACSVFLFPNQVNYMLLTRNIILAFVMTLVVKEKDLKKIFTPFIVAVFVLIFINKIPYFFRDLSIRVTNKDSYFRAIEQTDKLKMILSAEESIAVWPNQYFIYKSKFNVFDLYWLSAKFENIPSYYVLSYADSGDLLKPIIPPQLPWNNKELIYNPQLPQPTKVLGIQISKSSNTWETAVYKNLSFSHK